MFRRNIPMISQRLPVCFGFAFSLDLEAPPFLEADLEPCMLTS